MTARPSFSPSLDRAGPAIELVRLGKQFPLGRDTVAALDDVSFSVAAGELVALIGPSGCGKSTLLRIVADLLPPSFGVVRVFGEPPRALREQRAIGFVFQSPVLLPWSNVFDNVCLPLTVAGRVDGSGRRRVQDLIDLVGLSGFERARPSQLSGGMRQRVALARALVTTPRILLLDEPFGALDEITRQRMNLELLRIWREVGVTTLLVTHSIPEAVFLSHRVFVLTPRPGRISTVVDIELGERRDLTLLREPTYYETCAAVSEALYETGSGGGSNGASLAGATRALNV